MTASWLVTLSCTRCGAPGNFVAAQLIAICTYCGHVIGTHRAMATAIDNLAYAEARSFVIPTLADVRRLELADRKHAALEARDPTTLHAAALELAALDALDAGMPPAEVARWARWTAAIEHVAAFGRVAMFSPDVAGLVADPAGYAAHVVERYTGVYRELIADEQFPVELATTVTPEQAAVDAMLGCLTSWFAAAPLSAITAALVVLGHRPVHVHGASLPCRTCGAPLCAQAMADLACTYCRSPIELRRHVWLDGMLRAVAMANADTLVMRERAYAVVAMLIAVAPLNGEVPEAMVGAYLEAVDGVTRAALDEITAFVLAHHGLAAAPEAIVRQVRGLLDRVPEAVASVPGPRRGAFVGLPPSEAWRRAAARNWRRVLRYATLPVEQRGLVAVNQLLAPLAGGYLPDAGDAAEFLRETGESLDQIRAAIELHRSAESDRDKREFWRGLSERLV